MKVGDANYLSQQTKVVGRIALSDDYFFKQFDILNAAMEKNWRSLGLDLHSLLFVFSSLSAT
jgi:hypothetical protein